MSAFSCRLLCRSLQRIGCLPEGLDGWTLGIQPWGAAHSISVSPHATFSASCSRIALDIKLYPAQSMVGSSQALVVSVLGALSDNLFPSWWRPEGCSRQANIPNLS